MIHYRTRYDEQGLACALEWSSEWQRRCEDADKARETARCKEEMARKLPMPGMREWLAKRKA